MISTKQKQWKPNRNGKLYLVRRDVDKSNITWDDTIAAVALIALVGGTWVLAGAIAPWLMTVRP